ncbi:GumC family protein [Methylocystis parvus]|uniref:Polysaccharide biosynthesis tyrosine autokinase n=1 Tax=Methylocystis parvus TaxID=134 RepID=A0A6B8M945_9HYPH|nr:exopolysaccharide transport family protein [Methylocystis parvus]QGM99251.1 polysaccharide biosynthesis tyrosine autokinase [Methylocystis parvus]WBK00368.1 exopolysaccharide transport family protein [Methylocystis parvus OBBP]
MRADIPIETEAVTNEVDLSHVGRALKKKRWWVIGPTLVALAGALVFVNVVKPRYTSEARLLLENQDDFYARVDKGERIDANGPDAEGVQSQIQLLTSRDLARRVIKQLGLQGNVEFDSLANGMGALTRVMVLLGLQRDPTQMSPEDRILEKFGEKLSVLSPTKTRVLSIEFSSRNPDLAARGANAVADAYIEMQQEAKRSIARTAAQSLATLVSDLHGRVAEAEAKVEDYRAKTGLLVGANNTVIPTQQLGELNNQLSNARGVQADAQAKANILRDMLRQNRIGEIPDVANNEVMRRIFEQRVALRAQLALESRTLLPQHPRIKELEAQLHDLDMQWRAAAERTARTLENEARIASVRVENLTKVLDDQKRVAGAAGAEEVKLRDLERAARLLKDQLETETAKYQEALARERVKATPADARIIQRGLAPQLPSFPKKLPIAAFATLATLILSTGAIVAGELLTGRARVAPPAAPLDAPQPEPVRIAAQERSAAPAERLAETVEAAAPPVAPPPAQTAPDVIHRIDSARAAQSCVKVLVTPCEKDGKPAETAIALARNLARRGRTLLAAADPGARAFDALVHSPGGAPKGMADLSAGVADFAEVIHRDVGSRLHVLPGGIAAGDEQYELSLIVTALAHTYDFIVFAASPDQALRLAAHVDLAFVLGGDAAAEDLRARLAQEGADAHLLEDVQGLDGLVAA